MSAKSMALILGSLLALPGCAKSGKLPSWYLSPPSGCAVGSAPNQGMMDMAKRLATQAARDDLARQLNTKVEGMIKNYMAQGRAEGQEFAEMDATSVSRTIVDTTLVGTVPTEAELIGEEFYMMVCLDLETFASAIEDMETMDARLRAAIRERAEEEFEDLDRVLDRNRNQ
mgnify:CR=1 FL=1